MVKYQATLEYPEEHSLYCEEMHNEWLDRKDAYDEGECGAPEGCCDGSCEPPCDPGEEPDCVCDGPDEDPEEREEGESDGPY